MFNALRSLEVVCFLSISSKEKDILQDDSIALISRCGPQPLVRCICMRHRRAGFNLPFRSGKIVMIGGNCTAVDRRRHSSRIAFMPLAWHAEPWHSLGERCGGSWGKPRKANARDERPYEPVQHGEDREVPSRPAPWADRPTCRRLRGGRLLPPSAQD